MRDQKVAGIFMQQEDYSCGAASLATLMHYYFGDATDESTLLSYIKQLFSAKEYHRIEQDGLSFLELETIAKSLGYQTASVRLKPESLPKLGGPVLIYIERKDYRHFAVYKGIVEDRVFIADPSRGNVRVPLSHFLEEWDGRTFIIGRAGFSPDPDHALLVQASSPLRNELLSLRSRLYRTSAVEPGFRSPLSTLRQ